MPRENGKRGKGRTDEDTQGTVRKIFTKRGSRLTNKTIIFIFVCETVGILELLHTLFTLCSKMPEDTKMEEESPKTEEKPKEEKPETPPLPPLEAAARRLERLLGGGLSDTDRDLHTYTNPVKVVRRWLGTASGAAGNATFEDIAAAAATVLDPEGPCAKGRSLIAANNDAVMDIDSSSKQLGFLTTSSSREVEAWLISLSVRLLWKEKKFAEAFDLVQKGIEILLEHLNVASTNLTSLSGVSTSSLFPPLARMYRYRSLVAEEMKNNEIIASLRQDMIKAHNLACLRRDVDCQATLLNLMLRDLLLHSQSKFVSLGVTAV